MKRLKETLYSHQSLLNNHQGPLPLASVLMNFYFNNVFLQIINPLIRLKKDYLYLRERESINPNNHSQTPENRVSINDFIENELFPFLDRVQPNTASMSVINKVFDEAQKEQNYQIKKLQSSISLIVRDLLDSGVSQEEINRIILSVPREG